MIKCGKCKDKHETVADVKACYTTPAPKVTAQNFQITSTPVTEAGIYRKVIKTKDAELTCIYRVRIGKSGHPYAEALTPTGPKTSKFIYAAGAIKTLTAEMKMTLAEAVEYGVQFGSCCACGRELKVKKSVEAGIGPVCIKKFQ